MLQVLNPARFALKGEASMCTLDSVINAPNSLLFLVPRPALTVPLVAVPTLADLEHHALRLVAVAGLTGLSRAEPPPLKGREAAPAWTKPSARPAEAAAAKLVINDLPMVYPLSGGNMPLIAWERQALFWP